jgi:imidazolonepropionase-like amidohydrolase
MIMTAHVQPDEALTMVTTAARQAMGIGASADRVRLAASTVREAIAFAPADRQLETQRSRGSD